MAKRIKKPTHSVARILGTIAQIVLILLLVSVAVAGFSSRIPFLANNGVRFFAVTSGSMETAIPTGSLIYSAKFNEDDLKEGDVITYYAKDSDDIDANSAIVTHRITNVIKSNSTELYTDPETGEEKEKIVRTHEFVTKGDANNEEDHRTVPVGNVIGLYKWHVPMAGFATAFAQGTQGFLLLVIVPGVILIVWEVISVMNHFKKASDAKSKAELDKIKAELKKEKAKSKSALQDKKE